MNGFRGRSKRATCSCSDSTVGRTKVGLELGSDAERAMVGAGALLEFELLLRGDRSGAARLGGEICLSFRIGVVDQPIFANAVGLCELITLEVWKWPDGFDPVKNGDFDAGTGRCVADVGGVAGPFNRSPVRGLMLDWNLAGFTRLPPESPEVGILDTVVCDTGARATSQRASSFAS